MTTKIDTISDGTTDHKLTKAADIPLLKINASPDITVKGKVSSKAGATLTCTVARQYCGPKANEMAWTLTRLCLANKQREWSVRLGKLPAARYVVTLRDVAGNLDCVELLVPSKKGFVPFITISNSGASRTSINVTGSVLNAGAQVLCSLTPTDSLGNPTALPSTKIVSASQARIWYVSFIPSDLVLNFFSGNYSFEAYAATEGTISRAFVV
jgi:hypothetical protein